MPNKQLYAVFCTTNLGNCIVIIVAGSDVEAESKAQSWLYGENNDDISDVTVTKTEELDTSEGPMCFWEEEMTDQ